MMFCCGCIACGVEFLLLIACGIGDCGGDFASEAVLEVMEVVMPWRQMWHGVRSS